jgi:beta-galactosidase
MKHTGMQARVMRALRDCARLASVAMLCICVVVPALAAPPASNQLPRERVSLNAQWRFHRGDPSGNRQILDYDIRPQVLRSEDGKVADAQPEQAQRLDATATRVLKPWILPTANALIADPAKRHERPPGHPGSSVAFVQPQFDDSGWERVDLPHDWAIAGPFLADGPSPPAIAGARCFWISMAPWPMPRSGSTASWSAAGRMATAPGAWT